MIHTASDCPLCHGPHPADFVNKIKSAKMGKPMTPDEFMRWLRENT